MENIRSFNGWLLMMLVGAFTVTGSAQARQQGRGGPPPDWGRPPFGDMRGPSFEMFSDNRVVKGAPYSAVVITETVRTLADGTRITHKRTDNVYRDSEGRTRREQTFDRVGPFSVGDQPVQIISIHDPVAGAVYFLNPHEKSVRKMPRFDRPAPFMGPPPPMQNQERKTELLGKEIFEGIEAEGTRITTTIPVGKIGNDRPIDIISERWESTALKIVILSKHKDPMVGETIYRLTEIKRSEPTRALFEIPADYTVKEERPGWPAPSGPLKPRPER